MIVAPERFRERIMNRPIVEFQDIIYHKEEGIATITLNRPETMNALTDKMREEWRAALEHARQDDEVRVVVVTGAGRAFSAGGNPRQMRHNHGAMAEGSEPASMRRDLSAIHHAAQELDKPYIGAVNGPAAGGGMDAASMCDIRIASDQARFSMAHVRMGHIPASGGAYFLPRIVGVAKACELIWTGDTLSAEEALRIGYVSKVVPHDELMLATLEFASRLVKGPSVAIQLAKRLIYQCLDLDLTSALRAHREAQLIAANTEDAQEGPRAWAEKREPIFKGR
jgi:enoyl-CoA hydratase/carnithine racemase